jgi:hypothetical protein
MAPSIRKSPGLGQYGQQNLSLCKDEWYGNTKQGKFMNEKDALAQGYR